MSRFQVGDKVRIVRIIVAPAFGPNEDLSEKGQEELEKQIGSIVTIKEVAELDRTISYEMTDASSSDSYWEQELDWP